MVVIYVGPIKPNSELEPRLPRGVYAESGIRNRADDKTGCYCTGLSLSEIIYTYFIPMLKSIIITTQAPACVTFN